MKCLAVRQPWAWALTAGAKDIENRSWTTAYRGPVVIQASSSKTSVNKLAKTTQLPRRPMALSFGALIGVVDLIDVRPLSPELEKNPWAWGPYCWRVANARRFATPIAAKGKLNLYSLSPELAEQVEASDTLPATTQSDPVAAAWVNAMIRPESVWERARGLFSSYFALRDAPNALRLAESVVRQRQDAEAYIDRALAKLIADDFTGTIADADKALDLSSANARAYFVRGLGYDRLGRLDLAARDRGKAEALDPRFDAMDSADEEEE